MPFLSRFLFAFACFFRVLFNGRFAAHVHEAKALFDASAAALPEQPALRLKDEASVTDEALLKDGAPLRDEALLKDGAQVSAEKAAAKDVATPAEASEARAVEAAAARDRGALMLLALLQREGRFVDFVQQEVTEFDDEQVAAAARVVHEGCRRALRDHVTFVPVRGEQEGDRVVLAEGYDVGANKLVGNVTGKPPYKGTVQHRGWRAAKLKLPQEVGAHDATVVAQAEIEL